METSQTDTDMCEAPSLPDRSLPLPPTGNTGSPESIANICSELDGAVANVHGIMMSLHKVREVVLGGQAVLEGHQVPTGPAPAQLPVAETPQPDIRPLQDKLHNVMQINETLKDDLNQKQIELREARAELARSREKEAMLRSIVLDKTGDQRVIDQEIKDKFVALRQKAQAIANSSAYDVNQTPARVRGETIKLFDPKTWNSLNTKDRKNCLMAEIFDFLYYHVLDFKMFYRQVIACAQPVAGRKSTVEPDLERFETLLEYNNVNESLITDWRIATIDCVAKLTGQAPRGKALCRDMFDNFKPILSPAADGKQLKDLQEQFNAMCDDAWDLRMIMRKSREGHRCVRPPTRDKRCLLNDFEKLVEPITVEGGKTKERSDEIAYSLFGALVKGTAHSGNPEGVVLEKAQIVLKRR